MEPQFINHLKYKLEEMDHYRLTNSRIYRRVSTNEELTMQICEFMSRLIFVRTKHVTKNERIRVGLETRTMYTVRHNTVMHITMWHIFCFIRNTIGHHITKIIKKKHKHICRRKMKSLC